MFLAYYRRNGGVTIYRRTSTLAARSLEASAVAVALSRDVVADAAAGVGTAERGRGTQIAAATLDADSLVQLQTRPRTGVVRHVQLTYAADEPLGTRW